MEKSKFFAEKYDEEIIIKKEYSNDSIIIIVYIYFK